MTSSGILKYDTLMKYLNYVFCVKLFSVRKDVLEVKLFKHLEAIGFNNKIQFQVKPKHTTKTTISGQIIELII